jgi:hypothetical protein
VDPAARAWLSEEVGYAVGESLRQILGRLGASSLQERLFSIELGRHVTSMPGSTAWSSQ